MRLAKPFVVIALLAAVLIAGCGSDDEGDTTKSPGYGPASTSTAPQSAPEGAAAQSCDTYAVDAEGLRATGVSCGEARKTMFAWQRAESCGLSDDASRGACSVSAYRCLATKVERGSAVNCARPGRSISFAIKR